MKLKNDFKEEERYLFLDKPYCWDCESNQQMSIHHVIGRKSKSIFNARPLCHECHKKADTINTNGPKGKEYRIKHLKEIIPFILKQGYKMQKHDYEFFEEVEEELNEIRLSIVAKK